MGGTAFTINGEAFEKVAAQSVRRLSDGKIIETRIDLNDLFVRINSLSRRTTGKPAVIIRFDDPR